MYSNSFTLRWNQALKHRHEIKEEDPSIEVYIYVRYAATLMLKRPGEKIFLSLSLLSLSLSLSLSLTLSLSLLNTPSVFILKAHGMFKAAYTKFYNKYNIKKAFASVSDE